MKELFKLLKENDVDKNNIIDYIPQIAKYLNGRNIYQVLVHLKQLYDIDFDQLIGYCANQEVVINYNSVASRLISINRHDIVSKYINYFMKNNPRLLELKKTLMDNNMDVRPINEFIKNNPYRIIDNILFNASKNMELLKQEKVYEFMKELISELLMHEDIGITDIECVNKGSLTSVYSIGSKVLKIGLKRHDFKMNNHRLFLQPLLRKELYSKDNQFLCCVEIVEKLNTKNITEEDLYSVYKQLRDDGLVWIDVSKNNVGRLIKDNKIYFHGIEKVDHNSVGYNNDNNEILKKGDLVLADNEYIYEYDINNFLIKDHLKNNSYALRYAEEKENVKIV